MRVLITTNSKHGLCLESVDNMLITTFVNNELITLPTLLFPLLQEADAAGTRQMGGRDSASSFRTLTRRKGAVLALAHCLRDLYHKTTVSW